ncbi:MAG TPA: bifunctional DNA-formamidopyrimidine glycosylase/DNA-(apurinic or apyrimidinic site) lyase [Candidatus Binataceae bacterium]
MPELPEVESLRRLLMESARGRIIVSARTTQPRLRRLVADDFDRTIAGRTIGEVSRRAKYLLIGLSGGMTLLVHLGMSGSLTHRGQGFGDGEFDPAHDHLRFELDDNTALVYNDPRRFGLLKLVPTAQVQAVEELSALGPEPLEGDFNAEYLFKSTRGRRAAIKNLLMDQRVVAGIGNIYACEILFGAKVRPGRAAGRITRAEAGLIVECTKGILSRAIGSGGTTFRSYRDSRGLPGRFSTNLQVYGREGEPCLVCRSPIKSRVLGQRSSFYCPVCQR